MLFSIIWDVAIEGIHLLEYNWFNSHPPKNSVSDLFPVFLSIEFLLFYQKSHPSCKRAGVFSQERHSSSGSPHMHAPLHAPVTVNDARPSWFFGWTLFFAGACVWFPVVAQISLGMLEKPQRKELTPVLYLLTCRITCWHVVVRAGKDLKHLDVKWWTLCYPSPQDWKWLHRNARFCRTTKAHTSSINH